MARNLHFGTIGKGRGKSFRKKVHWRTLRTTEDPPFNGSRSGCTPSERFPILWHAGNFVLLTLVCAFSVDPELQVRARVVQTQTSCLNTVHTTAVSFSTPLRSLCLTLTPTRNAPIQRTRLGLCASVLSAISESSVTRRSDRIWCPPPNRLTRRW